MRYLTIFLSMMLSAFAVTGQGIYLKADAVGASPHLQGQFAKHTLLSIDTRYIFSQLKMVEAYSPDFEIDIELPGLPDATAVLHQINLLDEQVLIKGWSEATPWNPEDIYTLQGYIKDQKSSQVTLTISANLIAGAIETEDGHTYFIEPLRYLINNASSDQYVIYNNGDVLESQQARSCLAAEAAAYSDRDQPLNDRCKPLRLDIGLANDYGMVNWLGTQTAVIQHNLAIMNLVQSNYDDEFNWPVRLNVVAIFVSSCDACDPWSATDEYAELHDEFREWLSNGGLGTTDVDWAAIYTPREFTVLFASFTAPFGLCTYSRTTLFSFYDAPMCTKQKIAARALGTSLGASSGAQSGIMSSGGTCSNSWHPNSSEQINYGLSVKPCLSECIASPPIQPLSMMYINTPTTVCYTFNAPCVAGYQLSTSDPALSITTSGTTICLQSSEYGPRTARVFLSAIDFCGRSSELGLSWTVYIDMGMALSGHPSPTGVQLDANELKLSAAPNEVLIQDSHELPLSKTLMLYDFTGRLLMEYAIGDALARISLNHLPQGMYVARLVAPGRETITKTVYRF